jgi:hypothetical protein
MDALLENPFLSAKKIPSYLFGMDFFVLRNLENI